jgi:hypothetical protein
MQNKGSLCIHSNVLAMGKIQNSEFRTIQGKVYLGLILNEYKSEIVPGEYSNIQIINGDDTLRVYADHTGANSAEVPYNSFKLMYDYVGCNAIWVNNVNLENKESLYLDVVLGEGMGEVVFKVQGNNLKANYRRENSSKYFPSTTIPNDTSAIAR